MCPNVLEILLSGKAPDTVRTALARGITPLPPNESLRALVFLTDDSDQEIASSAQKTLSELKDEAILPQLKSEDCAPSVLKYFGVISDSDRILQAIILNPTTPGTLIESLSLSLPPQLLSIVLDNRVRILEYPDILKNIKFNPLATPDIKRLVGEIETEFFGDKKREYFVEQRTKKKEEVPISLPDLEFEIPKEDLSIDGLPIDDQTRNAVLGKNLSNLPVREKIRYALFGTREIRALLIRDTNREISRMVLRSPKITESEIESISSMRGVSEDILREIGNNKDHTKNYSVAHNLVKNPKTPPAISQRLIFKLRSQDLTMLTRDRSISDAVRFHATRTLSQRARKGSK
jgi:hypothetical protein